jgi:NADH-ubiquinone oxidoreductase chain 4
LAGVLLKLGGYGIIRIFIKLVNLISFVSLFFVRVSLVGIFFIGLVCCRLNDLKALVAYSSVAHMGLVICGIFTGTVWGLNGGLIMMVSHGIGSSGLFCFVNLVYERSGSRRIYVNRGLISILPLFRLLIFLLCCSNISAPPTINLLSEISLIISVYIYERFCMFLFPLGSFLGAVFTFYVFSYSQHGKYYLEVFSYSERNLIEYHVLVFHLIPINFLILKNDLFIVLF